MVELRSMNAGATPLPAPDVRLPLAELEPALLQGLNGGEDDAVDAFEAITAQAVLHRASDIHFEPWHDCLMLRFRIDGLLHDVARLPKAVQERLTARIKVLAKMVVYKKDLPQDGRIDPGATRCGKAMRAATFPTINGEKTVIRIMDSARDPLPLDRLGFSGAITKRLDDFILRPQGTLLLTGPSSSGKTTTIYAVVREMLARRCPCPHAASIEDPVEVVLDHVAQTEVNPQAGFTFAAALRAVLRQDPEVIVVGEIRDPETARTAIQAGLTGHLVISTIHSGTAAGVFTRLLDMGIEPFLVASSVTGVLAQRLVRLNCPHCTAPYRSDEALRALYGLADADPLRRGTGCDACAGVGYLGRTAIGEMLAVNEELANLVLARSRTRLLHDAAVRSGMTPLLADGLNRVRQGATTVEELRRVLPPPDAPEEEPAC